MEPKMGPIRHAMERRKSAWGVFWGWEGVGTPRTSVSLSQLHSSHDHTGHDLTGALDDLLLGHLHVETTHASELLVGADGHETLDGEGTERTVVAGGGDDNGGVDGVGVHARLVLFSHISGLWRGSAEWKILRRGAWRQESSW
jgi:hypothetical protein